MGKSPKPAKPDDADKQPDDAQDLRRQLAKSLVEKEKAVAIQAKVTAAAKARLAELLAANKTLEAKLEAASKSAEKTAAAPVVDLSLEEATIENRILREQRQALVDELRQAREARKKAIDASQKKPPEAAPKQDKAEEAPDKPADDDKAEEAPDEPADDDKAEEAPDEPAADDIEDVAGTDKQGKALLKKLHQAQATIDDLQQRLAGEAKPEPASFKTVLTPSNAVEIDALASRVKALEHRLTIVTQERDHSRHELETLRQTTDSPDDGAKNALALTVVPTTPDFPEPIMKIIRDVAGDQPLAMAAGTREKVDVGSFLKGSVCYLVMTPREVFVVAAGKTDFIQRLPRESVSDSFWNPVTGQLVLHPAGPSASKVALAMEKAAADTFIEYVQAGELVVAEAAPDPA